MSGGNSSSFTQNNTINNYGEVSLEKQSRQIKEQGERMAFQMGY
jgi:hypothetical protein